MINYRQEYQKKLVAADQAVQCVKSGDWVAYSHFAMTPKVLDQALARRKEQLTNVNIRGVCSVHPLQVAKVDPDQKHFQYNSGFFSGVERKMQDEGLAFHIPGLYQESPVNIRNGQADTPRVAMLVTTPMDEKGYFNLGASNSYERAVCEMADVIIVEINEKAPRCLGGSHESVHISEVDYIVEGNNEPLFEVPSHPAAELDQKIAAMIVEEIEDGACLQLGIGGMPNTVGQMIAESDLKDLGVHSEMLCGAFVDLYEAGKITGARKNIDRFKMVFTFALGDQKLYDFADNNPCCAIYPVDYTNSAETISQNDKQISINNAIEIDLYGQVCSETAGARQISGTGGQFDFTFGAVRSKGGKAFICLSSAKKLADKTVSRIVPTLTAGNVVTVPRTVVQYVVTEHGKVNLKGKSTWQRAELLIDIAHPDYRDHLIKEAEKQKIWSRTNKLV